jgi:hypothetical protein
VRNRVDALAAYCAIPLVLDGVTLRGKARLRLDRDPIATEWRTERAIINANIIDGEVRS